MYLNFLGAVSKVRLVVAATSRSVRLVLRCQCSAILSWTGPAFDVSVGLCCTDPRHRSCRFTGAFFFTMPISYPVMAATSGIGAAVIAAQSCLGRDLHLTCPWVCVARTQDTGVVILPAMHFLSCPFCTHPPALAFWCSSFKAVQTCLIAS
jgi:hypothetical protein